MQQRGNLERERGRGGRRVWETRRQGRLFFINRTYAVRPPKLSFLRVLSFLCG
ncbi:MAG: hypothetical protein ACHBN1_05660 [Heteroscytonema crispum UTEX LB 1556]